PVLAALTSASTASCAVLKDCWAFATGPIANASTAAVNEISLVRGGAGLVKERIVIITSSLASESRVQLFSYLTLRLLRALPSLRPSSARSSETSVPNPGGGWDPCARCDPTVVSLELQAELLVEDLKVAVLAAHDRLRHDRFHFLRHDADIDLVAAVI